MDKSRTKYIAGLLLFGVNEIIASKIMLSSTDIVFYRTLTGSIFLILLCAVPGIFRRVGRKGLPVGRQSVGNSETAGHWGWLECLKN